MGDLASGRGKRVRKGYIFNDFKYPNTPPSSRRSPGETPLPHRLGVASIAFVIGHVPETRGKTLEQIETMLRGRGSDTRHGTM